MNNEYDLRMRLAVRIANRITHNLIGTYSTDQVQLIFDALSDGLGGRGEEELLSLVYPEKEIS